MVIYYVEGRTFQTKEEALREVARLLKPENGTITVAAFESMEEYCEWRFDMMVYYGGKTEDEAYHILQGECGSILEDKLYGGG